MKLKKGCACPQPKTLACRKTAHTFNQREIGKMKKRFVVIYRMLDQKGLLVDSYYCQEEAEAAVENLEYADERDVVLIVDVEDGKCI